MSDEEIHVVVEGENADDGGSSSARRIKELNEQADRDHAYAARTRLQTAHLRREAALRGVDAAMLTADSELKAAESQYESARELGDIAAEKAAVRRMSAVEARNSNLQMQRASIERAPITSGDPVEDHLSQFSDRTASWLRQHPEFVSDPRQNARAIGAHHMALSEGLTPDTDMYFEHCERTLGLRRGGNGGSNRGGSMRGGSSGGGSEVRLSKGEVERANDGSVVWNVGNTDTKGNVIRHGDPRVGKPIGNVEYARRRIEMEKQGYYQRI